MEFVKPVDTMGAGDAFASALLVNIASNLQKGGGPQPEDFLTALQAATRFAAKVCLVQGAFGYGKIIPQGYSFTIVGENDGRK